MNILLLTPIYPASDLPKTSTPVVHYFAREWAKLGYNVQVCHYIVNFPLILYKLSAPFQGKISAITGSTIRIRPAIEKEYELEGVRIKRIPLRKLFPHSRYHKLEILSAIAKTIEHCNESKFIPDYIIGHWFNPQIEIIAALKEHFNVPTCLVLHDSGRDLKTIFRHDSDYLMSKIDILGYRSDAIKRAFESYFSYLRPSFYCYSGIPEKYISDEVNYRNFDNISSFIFVGTLFQRKYPSEIILALNKSYPQKNFQLTYIGKGEEENKIRKIIKKYSLNNQVRLLGHIERCEVQTQMCKHDIFVMISKHEAFGLVYLEAMANGCITIASRNEGFDGIIIDGKNGFLCEAGNWKQLSDVINHIKSLTKEELLQISNAAINTAKELTDKNVAVRYIENIKKYSLKNK